MSFGGLALGARGERLARVWYEQHGFVVVACNWRCEIGEIDLIARHGDTVVIAEVKARTSDRFGLPAEAVGRTKQMKLRRLAAAYLAASGTYAAAVRFDVVSIIGRDVSVIPAAF